MITTEKKRIALCCPTGEDVRTAFAVSLFETLQYTVAHADDSIEWVKLNAFATSMLPWSRHELARISLAQGATHLLWIDSDMQFPADMILRWAKRDEPIIGINAMSRRPPYNCTAQNEAMQHIVTSPDSTGFEKVGRTGFGIIWVAAEVFRAVPQPWFNFQWLEDRQCYRGEDYFFLEAAKRAGYGVVIDHDISKKVVHIGQFGYTPLLRLQQEAQP